MFIITKFLIKHRCMKWLVNKFSDQLFQVLDVLHVSYYMGTRALLDTNTQAVTAGRHCMCIHA